MCRGNAAERVEQQENRVYLPFERLGMQRTCRMHQSLETGSNAPDLGLSELGVTFACREKIVSTLQNLRPTYVKWLPDAQAKHQLRI